MANFYFLETQKKVSWVALLSTTQEGSGIQIRKILSDTTLIMLERTMHLVIILLLVKCRFQNH